MIDVLEAIADKELSLDEKVKIADDYLNEIPRFAKTKHGIPELRQMMDILDLDIEDGPTIIHVAGTNGKGSVCAYLESIFRTAGKKTALFISPHLVKVTERFVFDGVPVADELFLEGFAAIKKASDRFDGTEIGRPTYFEYLYLIFLWLLRKIHSQVIIFETGLGGRLDSTNSLKRKDAAVITSISLDHVQYLGDTVEKIAWEKAGILCEGTHLFYDNTVPEASRVILETAEKLHVPAAGVAWDSFAELKLEGAGLKLITKEGLELAIPFPAEYQGVNAMLAVKTAEYFGVSMDDIKAGIEATKWPGRMEEIAPSVFLDGAHNEGGIRAFTVSAKNIINIRKAKRVIVLFAVSSDKEYEEMAERIYREIDPDVYVVTRISSYRALDIELLRGAVDRAAKEYGDGHELIEVHENVGSAFKRALHIKQKDDIMFCVGSLYLIGEIKEMLK